MQVEIPYKPNLQLKRLHTPAGLLLRKWYKNIQKRVSELKQIELHLNTFIKSSALLPSSIYK